MRKPYMPFTKKDFLNPSQVVGALDIKKGQVVIDFGCGSGFWTIPFAKAVGPKGLVIATDPRQEKLDLINAKSVRLGLNNIKLIKSPLTSLTIPAKEIADFIIISHVLSDINSDLSLIFSARKNAKIGTALIVVDWNEKTHLGPENSKKTDIETVILEARRAGFEFKKLIEAGSHHFGLYFEYMGGKTVNKTQKAKTKS